MMTGLAAWLGDCEINVLNGRRDPGSPGSIDTRRGRTRKSSSLVLLGGLRCLTGITRGISVRSALDRGTTIGSRVVREDETS